MELQEFLKSIKEDKNGKFNSRRTKIVGVSTPIHLKIKQISSLYDIPISNLVDGIIDQWMKENKKEIIADKIKSIDQDF